jgi:glucose/arabinose dehydrogenase
MGPDSRDAVYDSNGTMARDVADLVTIPGSTYRDPIFSFLVPVGVTSIAFLGNSALPKNLRRSALIADSRTGNLYLLKQTADLLDFVLTGSLADRVADSASSLQRLIWATNVGTITDIRIGPDGFVYLSDLTSRTIYRIRPK